MEVETREALKLFIEKANKLLASRYVDAIVSNGLSWKASWNVNTGFSESHVSPDQEAIDAFVLTIRFFIQVNERISFRSLNENVLIDPGVSDNWKTEFVKVRTDINQLLDSHPAFNYIVNSRGIENNRELMEIFIYGGLAHANPQKKEIYDRWIIDKTFYSMIEFQFNSIMVNIFKAIRYISFLSQKEIENEDK